MSEAGSNYIPVEANSVMPMAEGGSGGYQVGGYYVNWTTAGITGKGWDQAIKMTNSPFEGMTENDILNVISSQGDLDTIFREWGKKYDAGEELAFLIQAEDYYRSTPEGCIGDQKYV